MRNGLGSRVGERERNMLNAELGRERGRFAVEHKRRSPTRLAADFRGQLLPSLREVAAQAMTRDCLRCPERVVPILMEGAQSDPAPTVRACCARCLGELRFRTLSCRSLLESLRNDDDPRVRAEAEWALARFNQP